MRKEEEGTGVDLAIYRGSEQYGMSTFVPVETTSEWGRPAGLAEGKYSFVNAVARRVRDRVFFVGGRVRAFCREDEDNGLVPLNLLAADVVQGGQAGTKSEWASLKVYDAASRHVAKRIGHTAETLLDDQYIYVFGGEGVGDDARPATHSVDEGNALGDLVRCQILKTSGEFVSKYRWEVVTPTVPEQGELLSNSEDAPAGSEDGGEDTLSNVKIIIPPPRRWHASAKLTDIEMVIFGGVGNDNTILGDLCSYDAIKNHWQEPLTTGISPGARHRHLMVAIDLTDPPPPWPPLEKVSSTPRSTSEEDGQKEGSKEEAEPVEEGEEDTCPFVRATPGAVYARIVVVGGDAVPGQDDRSNVDDQEFKQEGSIQGSLDGKSVTSEGSVDAAPSPRSSENELSLSSEMFVLTVAAADDGLERSWTWSSVAVSGAVAPMLSLRSWYQGVFACDVDITAPDSGEKVPLLVIYGGRRREGMAPTNLLALNTTSGELSTLAVRPYSEGNAVVDVDALNRTKAFAGESTGQLSAASCPSLLGHSMVLAKDGTVLIFGGWDGRQHRGDGASLRMQAFVGEEDLKGEEQKALENERTIEVKGQYTYHGDTALLGLGRVRHGQGVCTHASGDIYEGGFVNDRRDGMGRLQEAGIEREYEGNWCQGKRSGSGKQCYSTGEEARNYYEGGWLDDQYHGTGELVFHNGIRVQGTFVSGELEDSKATVFYPDGGTYTGTLKRDTRFVFSRNGQGKMVYMNKEVYDGCWKEDKRCGTGQYLYNNGDTYMGNWSNGRKNGFGEMIFWNRNKYQGKWVADHMQGTGTMAYAAGHIFAGTWNKSKYHGRGRMSRRDGTVIEGTWRDGLEVMIVSRKK